MLLNVARHSSSSRYGICLRQGLRVRATLLESYTILCIWVQKCIATKKVSVLHFVSSTVLVRAQSGTTSGIIMLRAYECRGPSGTAAAAAAAAAPAVVVILCPDSPCCVLSPMLYESMYFRHLLILVSFGMYFCTYV